METPSYVVIKSNFPTQGKPYQTVTVFGSNQSDRDTFCREIENIGGIKIEFSRHAILPSFGD